MEKSIKVGLIGFGTVGSGTARILLEQKQLLSSRAQVPIELVAICDKDITSDRGFPVPESLLTTNINDIFENPEISIVIELIGGTEPAKSFILEAIKRGKHVVTANKALLATHGPEIFGAAAKNNVEIGFEASVGGGIPVIKSVKEGLVANNIHTVMGIMNGTANYILSRMTDEGLPFDHVLKEAQAHGYAEADPTYDIEGIDTAHKLAILATLAFGTSATLDDVDIEGISRLSPIDMAFAKELGYHIKLLAIGRSVNDEIELRVHPTMVPIGHLLAQVDGAYNAFYFIGDSVGKVLLYGMGAGQMPTGSAVVADVVDIARNIRMNALNRIPSLGLPFDKLTELKKRPMESLSGRYYFRFAAIDQPGVLARISGVLAEYSISIASVVQKGRGTEKSVPIVMLTHEAKEENVQKALGKIDNLDIVQDRTVVIRIEDLKSLEGAE